MEEVKNCSYPRAVLFREWVSRPSLSRKLIDLNQIASSRAQTRPPLNNTPTKHPNMTTRARQSTGQPTPARQATSDARRSTAGFSNTEPPDYESPEFSLNPAAQRALAALTRTHDVSRLDRRLDEARDQLMEAAVDINDIIYERNQSLQRTREKRRQEDADDGEDGSLDELEQSVEQMRTKVKGMTERMEQRVRKVIDGKRDVQHMKDAVAATAEDARHNASTQASTLNTRSQRTRRRRNDEGDDEEEEGSADEELPDFNPTDPAAGTAPVNAPLDVFSKQLDDMKTRYQSFNHTARYAEDNDYINFKRAVHDAQYRDDEVPLPDRTEWFNDDGTVAALGVTGGRNTQAGAEDDSDDDIAVSRATISTKCSLSLMEFTDPITSKKCPHSFEKEYIFEFIDKSNSRLPPNNGRPGERAVQCPVPGCEQMLSRSELQVDPVLVRKIKRLQKAKEMVREDEEDEQGAPNGTQHRAHHFIDDDDDEEGDATNTDDMDVDEPQVKTKEEPPPTGASRAGASAPPRPSQAVDLLDDDGEEEEEDLYN